MSFGEFLKEIRQNRYRSAREFCLREGLAISYPQYSRYESGEQLPSLETALSLGLKLGADQRATLRQWCLDQVGPQLGQTIRDILPEVAVQTLTAKPLRERSLDHVIVFNRQHLRLFESDPLYRDFFTYVNAFAMEEQGIEISEVAQALGIENQRANEMVARLDEVGVLSALPSARVRASKKTYYFPDDVDFFKLRNQNLTQNLTQILKEAAPSDYKDRRAFRGLVSRELTADQVEMLMVELEAVLARMMSVAEDRNARSVYSLCVAFGKRFERPASALLAPAIEESSSPGLVVASPLANEEQSVADSALGNPRDPS